jgi:hypothetical protein
MNYFARRLEFETDADDVGSALRDGTADFTLLDTRSPAAYAAAHLPGAISLPHREIIVALGRDVKEMLGGFEYYVREGYPVEGADAARHNKDQSGLVTLPGETMQACSLPSERSSSSATPMAPVT